MDRRFRRAQAAVAAVSEPPPLAARFASACSADFCTLLQEERWGRRAGSIECTVMLSTPFGAESSHEEQRQIDALTKRPELTSAESSAPLLGFSFSLATLQQFIVKSRDALRLRLVGNQSGGDDQSISSPRREALLNAIRSVRVYEMKDVACMSIRGRFVAPERSRSTPTRQREGRLARRSRAGLI